MKLFELFGDIIVNNEEANKDIDETDQKASSLGDKFKSVGGGVAKAGKVMATGIGLAVGATTAAATQVAETTDRIDKMSQNMGFATDTFQEWDFVLSQTGGDIEQVAGGLAMLTEKAVDAQNGGEGNIEAFAKLGITTEMLADMSKEDIFASTIEGLQNMTDEAQRSALASELLGGAGEEMGALLNLTAEDVDNLRNQAHEMGLVLSEDAVAAGVAMTDQMDIMKRSLFAVITEALAPMMPVLMELMQSFIAILPPIVEFIQPLIEKLVPVISDLITRLLPVFTRLLDALMPVIDPLVDVFLALVEALLPVIEALLPLVELILPPLVTLIETLVPLIEWLANVISDTLGVAIEFITDVFESWLDNLDKVLDVLGKVGDVAGDVVGKVGDVAGGIGEGVGDFFGGIGENVGGFFSKFPSFDVGTNYVPKDMLAMVHEGEAIIPKAYNNGSMGAGVTVNVMYPNIFDEQGTTELTDVIANNLSARGVLYAN